MRKWLDGEVELTQEQQEHYEKNMKVFDLNEVMSHESECLYYSKQLQADTTTDWSYFIDMCNQRNFTNILKRKEVWHTSFILSSKLESLLG